METCVCCARMKDDVEHMVELAKDTYICNGCTRELNGIFAKIDKPQEIPLENPIVADEPVTKLYPKDIKSFLDQYVIGQYEAKKSLSVEIYNHFKRITNPDKEIQKNNILLIGDSGTGKTLLVQTLAKLLDLPLVITDMNNITEYGYVGKDAESILHQLVIAADGDISKAETGIIFLDEIDKIAKRNLTSSTDKDPSGEGAQTALLKIIEGTNVELKLEGQRQKNSFINTSNILFIGGGAFFGMDKIVAKNHDTKNHSIGFTATVDKAELSETIEITDEDFISFGFLPEFIGRFHVYAQLHKLTRDEFKKIIIEPKNSVMSQYQKLMKLDDIELEFSDNYIDSIVDTCYDSKRGARAIRGEIEKRMREIIFNINDQEKLIIL